MSETLLRDETARLAALAEYEILDTAPEKPFERIVQLVRTLLRVPMATVTFVDHDRQWFKARGGIDVSETERKVAVCDHTIRSAQPLMVPDLRADERFCDLPIIDEYPHIVSYLGVPLITPEGYALGALCAMDHKPHQFNALEIETLSEFAALVVDWLEMRRLSQTDFLTGAMMRRPFLNQLDKEIERHRKHGRPCALAVLDVDHFKRVNDTHGHAAGDEVLKAVASACLASLRGGDVFARLGGEEFALLLPESEAGEAMAAAERLRRTIEALSIPRHPDMQVTASFGLAPYCSGYASAGEWLDAADRELYRAKETGRNRCAIIGGGMP